ncbi:MAG TPA: hypothetical protein VLL54_20495 [Pyrinomonadaceae bacterium]|nr:hypothetical protein [Pyrinomonadaceae bacterium]
MPTTTDRVIYLLRASTDESQLAIVQIELSGKTITPGQVFAADENWLRNLKIRITNLSDKPITSFVLSGGLIGGVNEKLTTFESYEEGIAWKFGEYSDPKSGGEKRKGITLLSNQVVELGYESMDPYYNNAREFERGSFCKLELGPASIQFEDGTTETASRIKYKR